MKENIKSSGVDSANAANGNIETSGLSQDGLRRALFPPHDNTQEILHGVTVKDPFRPLENLDAPETAAWEAREQKQFADWIAPAQKSVEAATAFLTDAMNYDLYDVPHRYNDKYFRNYKVALAAQGRVEVADSADGPWKHSSIPTA